MVPKPHPHFSRRGQRRRERRWRRELGRGVVAMVCSGVFAGWVAAGAPGVEAVVPSPDPAAVQASEARERSVYYPNCDAARAAGVAPIHAGEPGYRAALDRDGDGIACEPYRRGRWW